MFFFQTFKLVIYIYNLLWFWKHWLKYWMTIPPQSDTQIVFGNMKLEEGTPALFEFEGVPRTNYNCKEMKKNGDRDGTLYLYKAGLRVCMQAPHHWAVSSAFGFWRQGLTLQPRLISISWCNLPCAKVTVTCHHARRCTFEWTVTLPLGWPV